MFALRPYQTAWYRPFFSLERRLTEAQVRRLVKLGEAQPREEATVARASGTVVDAEFRNARLAWLHPDPSTQKCFELLRNLVEEVNEAAYGFDLIGFAEPLQYTVYEAPSVGYDWHIDMIDSPDSIQRKLSITIQLSGPREYAGGDLELRDGTVALTAPRARGAVVAFPSWQPHRVTPVTRGTRRSLVAWVGGPRFR